MTLENLKKIARAKIPGCTTQAVSDTLLTLILNNACDDIAAFTVCLPTSKLFDVVADQGEYTLSSVIGDFLTPDKDGLWWYDGSQWMQVNARTREWMNKNRPTWRNLDSDDPQDYTIEGDTLLVVPEPDTSLTEGFKLYYGATPTYMTSDGHYPFSGSTTELTHLRPYDEVIIKFANWQLAEMLNKGVKPDVAMQEYYAMRQDKYTMCAKRRDISASQEAIFQGRRP